MARRGCGRDGRVGRARSCKDNFCRFVRVNADVSQKVTASHLKRDAYLYVRQSAVRQVFENTESTQRQYGLRQRAIVLGWPPDRVVVIDTDLGQSRASAADRADVRAGSSGGSAGGPRPAGGEAARRRS